MPLGGGQALDEAAALAITLGDVAETAGLVGTEVVGEALIGALIAGAAVTPTLPRKCLFKRKPATSMTTTKASSPAATGQ